MTGKGYFGRPLVIDRSPLIDERCWMVTNLLPSKVKNGFKEICEFGLKMAWQAE